MYKNFHNVLGFDFDFFVNGERISVQGTKDLNIGKKNLSSVDFANVGSQVKYVDFLNYYQKCFAVIGKSANYDEQMQ